MGGHRSTTVMLRYVTQGLTQRQKNLMGRVVRQLAALNGVRAVVLGGSYARGRARPDSDIGLGLFYSERAPFAIERLRELADQLHDTPQPTVTGFYEWGRWVNGGAWLTIEGQRVDLLYRSLEHVERTMSEAEAGTYEVDYWQQPPFGFFSGTYLGEVSICAPLFDPDGLVPRLKQRVARYPEALRQSIVRDSLWGVEFALRGFAAKFAAGGDAYGTTGCLVRCAAQLVLALFALNRVYFMNEKTALRECEEFSKVPHDLALRLNTIMSRTGENAAELGASVAAMAGLFQEVVLLSEGMYQPRYRI